MQSDQMPPDDESEDPSFPLDPDADAPRWQWPCCPQCDRRRQTRCPSCDLGSEDFPLADYLPPLESESGSADQDPPDGLLLMCPTCDEAFPPRFYRYCQQCGHDFGDGMIIEGSDADALTGRAFAVLLGLVLFALAMLMYFWWLFD
jgi:hypothetical protein